MKMTFRWYGSQIDPIPLKYVKQIPGMSGLMGLLDCRMLDEQGETVCLVDVQVEPVVRVVYCMPLFEEESNG